MELRISKRDELLNGAAKGGLEYGSVSNAFDKGRAQDLFEQYARQFSEDEMMEGDNWTPQKISSWLRSHGVSDQSEINFVIGVFRSELSGG